MMKSRKEFHDIVLSLEKIVRDGRQLVKGGSVKLNMKQLQQRIGVKPSLVDCLDGLSLLHEMHQSEYELYRIFFLIILFLVLLFLCIISNSSMKDSIDSLSFHLVFFLNNKLKIAFEVLM